MDFGVFAADQERDFKRFLANSMVLASTFNISSDPNFFTLETEPLKISMFGFSWMRREILNRRTASFTVQYKEDIENLERWFPHHLPRNR